MEQIATNRHLVSIETDTHTIEVSDGCLIIGERTFPDNCISLTPEATQAVLDALLVAQYGLEQTLEGED